MVPGGAPGDHPFEGDLTTSSLEQRTRTFDVAPSARTGPGGPAPGDVLKNRFVLHQCLADGSTSRLFRALDRQRESAGDPDPWVVLKVVTRPPGTATGGSEPRALQALRREAAIAQGFEHPNLPRIIGIDRDGPHTFVCMAWIEGESLAAILDSRGTRPMTRVQALHIVEGVGRALIHLHGQGITHADVKPGNILVTAQGEATLLDFGVAVGPGAGDLPAVRGFTPEYASPDVLAGGEPTPADDLFSLACVAYRMLGGHRAFGPVTAREAAAADHRPPRPGHLSPAQWRALDRALAFTPADRQPDIATFLAQLKGARDESLAITDLSAAEPAHAPEPVAPAVPVRRGPGGLQRTVAVLLLIVATGSIAAWWLLRAPDPVSSRRPAAPRPVTVPDAAPAGLPGSDQPAPVSDPVPASPGEVASRAPDVPVADTLPTTHAVAPIEAPVPTPMAAPDVAREPARAGSGITSPAMPAADSPPVPVEPAGPPRPERAALAPVTVPAPVTDTGAGSVDPAASGAGARADAGAETPSPGRTVAFASLTIRRYVEPDYPRNAAVRRVPGWVDVAFTVEPSGRTSAVRVVGAEPAGLFDDAALSAVRRWRFATPETGDRTATWPVSSQIRLRFDPR